jgi:MerR family transcriptional regulator/heat shock protein HspR
MFDSSKTNDNPVYTISVAARLLEISIQTLRMYEREGLIIPFKTKNNQRMYSDSDIERIRRIRRDINGNNIGINSLRTVISLVPCWMIVDCTEIDRENCESFKEYQAPCWTYKHSKNICENIDCRECEVYKINSDTERVRETIVEQYGLDKNKSQKIVKK